MSNQKIKIVVSKPLRSLSRRIMYFCYYIYCLDCQYDLRIGSCIKLWLGQIEKHWNLRSLNFQVPFYLVTKMEH